MTSFVRTIQQSEPESWVEDILSRRDDAVPMPMRPGKAQPGDYVYILYRGEIVARAEVADIEPVDTIIALHEGCDMRAKALVHYRGGWQRAPEPAPKAKGFQGIRYVDRLGLAHLDAEDWG